jgi:hypothetical protein
MRLEGLCPAEKAGENETGLPVNARKRGSCESDSSSVVQFVFTEIIVYGSSICLSCFKVPPALTNRDNPQHGWFPGIPFG